MYVSPKWSPLIKKLMIDALIKHFEGGKEYVVVLDDCEAYVTVDSVMHHVMWDGLGFGEDMKPVLISIRPYEQNNSDIRILKFIKRYA